jgi:hypothetical protein
MRWREAMRKIAANELDYSPPRRTLFAELIYG